jgi:ABC-2 type transport system permease protein
MGPMMVVLSQVVPGLIEDDPVQIAFVGDNPPGTVSALAETAAVIDLEYELRDVDSADEAEEMLDEGEIDAVLIDGERLIFRDEAKSEIVFALNEAIRAANLPAQIEALGLTPEDVAPLISPAELDVRLLDPPEEDEALHPVVALLVILAMFGAIVMYGQWVLLGVIEEKTSRVAEVLFGAVRPTELMIGKVAANLVLAMAQMGLGVVSGVIALALIGSSVDVPDLAFSGAAVALVAAVMGVVLYAFAYAAAGATVSRPEDATSAAMPIMVVLMLGYMGSAFVVISKPDSVIAVALSLAPPWSPIAMPARVALGSPAWWEVAIAFGLLAVTIVGMARLAGRIYTGAILQTGPRIGLLRAFRSSAE